MVVLTTRQYPGFDLSVYVGDAVDSLTLVANDFDRGSGRLSFSITKGTKYRIAAIGYSWADSFRLKAFQNPALIRTKAEPVFAGLATGNGRFEPGSTVTVNATANPGYVFSHWSSNGIPVSSEQKYGFYADHDRNLVAHFARIAPNDNFAAATLATGASWFVHGSNFGATSESSEPAHGEESGSRSVWWTWVAPQDGEIRLSAGGSGIYTTLAVYTGGSLSSLSEVSSGYDEVRFYAIAGTTYRIAVDSRFNGSGPIQLRLNYLMPEIPVSAHARRFVGIIRDGAGDQSRSGRITLTLWGNNRFVARLSYMGRWLTLRGQFYEDGWWLDSHSPLGTIWLGIDPNSIGEVHGSIVSGAGSVPIFAEEAGESPVPQAGGYTVLLSPSSDVEKEVPQGIGWARLRVKPNGVATVAGVLGDGTPFAYHSRVTKDGSLPVCLEIPSSGEKLVGWLQFRDTTQGDLDGSLSWYRAPGKKQLTYPDGFLTEVSVVGSRFVEPSDSGSVLDFPDDYAEAELVSPSIGSLLLAKMFPTQNGELVALPPYQDQISMTLKRNGMVDGWFVTPNTGKVRPFRGMVLQKQNAVGGYFLDGTQTGSVTLTPFSPTPTE